MKTKPVKTIRVEPGDLALFAGFKERVKYTGEHVADVKGSRRLQRILAFLLKRAAAGATTQAIFYFTRYCAISAAMYELKANGFDYLCVLEKTKRSRQRIHRYTLKFSFSPLALANLRYLRQSGGIPLGGLHEA